jgi:DMSO reductase family type II enzyme molybdopterin subunit
VSGLTRRAFLVGGAAGAAVLGLRALSLRGGAGAPGVTAPPTAPVAAAPPAYGGVGDVHRAAWRWDRVVRATHLRANCFGACAWDVYVKDGVVWREEQSDVYAREGAALPDFGPRGCQKGACYSSLMTAPDRVLHPLERVGPRGAGRWRRISWDAALDRLADAILDACAEGGPETVVYDNGTSNVDSGPSTVGEMRLFGMLGATLLDGFGGTGDLAMGAVQTWGTTFVDGSADDWCRADALVFWHCNPAATRIPDAHFASEARYHGAAVACVSPDLSPSALHAGLWVNPRPGTDAALALGVARALLADGTLDLAYVREQTDLPFLVREDDGRFLRASHLREGGSDDVFHFVDERSGEIVEAPGSFGQSSDSLALGGARPALAGRFEVETRTGRVAVRPVMERLRERVAAYDPGTVARITGVGPGTQARLAALYATSRRILTYASWGSNKSHHADLLQRTLILLSALRGQQGRPGSGLRFAAWISFEGGDELVSPGQIPWWQRQLLRVYTPGPRAMEDAIAAATRARLTWTPSHLFLWAHGGLDAAQDGDAMREAIARGWVRVRPAPEKPPRVFVASGVNPLRRWPLPQRVEEVLWPKLRLVAVLDTRLSATATKADLVLPAAGYYEKHGLKYSVAMVPYAVAGDRAVAPLGESKGEWEIMSLLARRLQERARARGLEGALATIGDRFSEDGALGPDDDEAVLDRILRGSAVTGRIGWDEARRLGAIPLRSAGRWGPTQTIGSEIERSGDADEGGTLSPSRIHVEGRRAWPTLTGRQQFYLDHPWFLAADEALPRWKPLPGDDPRHPIRLTGGHTRWSIHAQWRAHPEMLRLQRGGPSLWMSVEDARARGVRDHELVRVRNEHGAFLVRARPSPAVQPGEAILYHAWEPYQFPGRRGNMEVVATPAKPLHLVGDYGHLRPRVFQGGPVHAPRNVAVEIERIGG